LTNPDYWFAIADAEYKLGHMTEAEHAYEKVVELNPLDVDAWLDYSSILYEQKNLEGAIEIMSQAIKNNPDAAELYYRMVAYLFAKGEYNEALTFLEKALDTDPEKHFILFDYLPQLQENKVIIDIINRYTK
jgi:tetratricopeptide (TPR) repeat protein